MDRCLLGFLSPFEMRGHILEHDYSVIHDHTDRYGKR